MGMFDNIFGSDPYLAAPAKPISQAPCPPVGMGPAPTIDPTGDFDSTLTLSSVVSSILDNLIGREGNYVNNPNDSGGETIWGITVKTARAFRYDGNMKDMTRIQAKQIYYFRYWTQPRISSVYLLDNPIAVRLLDIAVNAGPSKAGTFLQRALNVLGSQGKYYEHLTVDGAIGDITLYDLDQFFQARGDEARVILLKMITAQQSVFYIECAENKVQNEDFEWGWQKNRAFGAL